MAFPTVIEATIEYPISAAGRRREGLADTYLNTFRTHIAEHKPADIQRDGDSVYFSGGMLRWVSKFNMLVPVQQGRLSATNVSGKLRVQYSLDMSMSAYFSLVLVPLLAWQHYENDGSLLAGVLLGLGAFLFTVGSNWLWVGFRFRHLLQRCWEDSRPLTVNEVRGL